MAKPYEFLCEPRDHPLRPPIQLRRNTLEKWRDLRDSHSTSRFPGHTSGLQAHSAQLESQYFLDEKELSHDGGAIPPWRVAVGNGSMRCTIPVYGLTSWCSIGYMLYLTDHQIPLSFPVMRIAISAVTASGGSSGKRQNARRSPFRPAVRICAP